ncbi:MAG: CHAP domain-containing protein [Miltoncostaeaceae bacterium]
MGQAAPQAAARPVATGFEGRLDATMAASGMGPTTDSYSAFSGLSPATGPNPLMGLTAGGPVGQRMAALASAELGVAESPPGSNDAPRIAEYRTATAGSGVGPWCSYFVSWVAAEAGVPIGPGGQGEGWVPSVKTWAEGEGRWIPSGSGAAAVGDLVLFDRAGDGVYDHIGIVTGVAGDGSIQTVEGNSSDAVSARSYGPGEYAGLVRLG